MCVIKHIIIIILLLLLNDDRTLTVILNLHFILQAKMLLSGSRKCMNRGKNEGKNVDRSK